MVLEYGELERDSLGSRGTDMEREMKNLLRILGAGYGAKKLGGGCISTIVIFLLLYWLFGVVF